MCGRYASFLPAEFIARLFATVNPLPNLAPTWNMAPTMDAPVVRLIDGNRHLDALTWGLVPYFTKELKKARKPINARSETITKSGMFKAAPSAGASSPLPPTTNGGTIPTPRRRCGTHWWRPGRVRGIWERWKSPQGRDPPDARHHHDRCEPATCGNSGPHAGHHRTAGLAALARRDCGRSELLAARSAGGRPPGLAARAARANNRYVTDATLMQASRIAQTRFAILRRRHLWGATQCLTTTSLWRI
jgi:hypothetical protein